MTNILVKGHNLSEPGQTNSGQSVTLTFDATGNGFSNTELAWLALTNDHTASIVSEAYNTVTGGTNFLGQLEETNNDLTTVVISGSQSFAFLSTFANPANQTDSVVTDIDATAAAPTTIQSSLNFIDAAATTGGVEIYAGSTNTSSTGEFVNGSSLNSNITIIYTGLVIEGGSGQDYIGNAANSGTVIDGNHSGDFVELGGTGDRATLGTGAHDTVAVGESQPNPLEAPGASLGDQITFGAPSTAKLIVDLGASAGSTAGTSNVGHTIVTDAAAGMEIQFILVGGFFSSAIANESVAVRNAQTVSAAEDAAVAALHGPGVAYFDYHSKFSNSEYLIATNHNESSVSSTDAIVQLVGVNLAATNNGGVVTLH